ncbi:MAG: phage terminase large subunit family protein, partial [Pirellulaceae bacterium]|nr:phage terminase large subunit family protein [Pirellulaceae bacterium]
TDPGQKPTWKGKRFRFLTTKPERSELWDEYVQLRQAHPEDEFGRIAHAFYLENRATMDAGAGVANCNRFDGQILPDGTQLEVSSLQRYYNEVARIGPEAVASEYDNDPPEEAGPIESGITPHRVQRQLSGYARKTIPPECTVLTQGIDVRKVALHWVVRAWRPDGTGFTIDYGIHEVHGTKYGSEDGLDVAVKRAILARLEATKETEFVNTAGQRMSFDLTLVDAGWRTAAVYSACAEAGLGVMPIMGFGKSTGCTQANFSDVQRRTLDKRPGDHWFLSRKGRLWLVCADTDHWKAWEHDRWMTAPGKPGCLTLFGQPSDKPERLSADEKSHHSYSRHICNEVEIEEPYQGTIRRRWKAKSENTHWLDASYYSDVGANMKGIRLAGPAISKPTQSIPGAAPAANAGRQRMSLGQMATAARGT